MKKCYICKVEQEINNFGSLKSAPDGHRYDCKDCRKIYREQNKENIKKKQAEYYANNKESLLLHSKEYRINNIEAIQSQKKLYRNREDIKEHVRIKNQEYLPIKKEKIKERRKTDLSFRLSEILRSKIHKMVKGKETSYKDLIGCNSKWFNNWIEYRFDDKMNWDNLGTYWQIDHILPITQFNHNNIEESKVCFHWTNFQPLHKTENRQKSNKILLHYYYNNLVSVIRFNNKHKEFLGYQALNESLMWLRKKLRYGKNATYDKEIKKSLEIDNPQPSIYVHNDENMMKVQRLNGIGSEEFNQLR